MLGRLIDFYERNYGYLATAIIVAIVTAALVYSPVGSKAKSRVAQLTVRDPGGADFVGKFRNDWGLRPDRFLKRDHAPPLDQFEPVAAKFSDRRTAQALFYSRDRDRDDAFVIVGAFEFPEGLLGAILIDRQGRMLHRWVIPPTAGRRGVIRSDYRVFPHGFALLKDGSIVVAYDTGQSLVRLDACGREVWRRGGSYHHAATLDPDNAGVVWTLRHEAAVAIDSSTGRDMQAVRLTGIEKLNPELDLFGARQKDLFDRSVSLSDPTHLNDAEPLPASLAPAFPQFSAGDLLMSVRNANLLLVVDPSSGKVKWHASGYWRRQHDPDWGRDGRIYVFNNNMHRGYSSIVAIDPKTNAIETVVDGARYEFYSTIRGKHQLTEDGRALITSAQQGRVFELDEKGEISFEFLNRFDSKTDESLVIADAIRVDRTILDFAALAACPN